MYKQLLRKGQKKRLASVAFTVLTALFLAITPVQAAEDGSDILVPSDVDNLKAVAGNGQITLTWDVATDNVGVTGYNIYYGTEAVTNEGGQYTKAVDAGNVVEYTVDKLENDKTYYFAVTAYDAAANESENYSLEASATTVSSKEVVDTEAPQVAGTSARYQTVVKVVFSEEIVLPKEAPELAFSITNTKSLEVLDVTEAMTAEDYMKDHAGILFDEEDEEVKKMTEAEKEEELKKTVVLITDVQKSKDEYKLEVSIDVEDKAGNPVASGTSDTGVFEGSGEAEPQKDEVKDGGLVADASNDTVKDETSGETPTTEDTEAPKLVSAMAITSSEVQVKFSEKIVLSKDPTNNFLIVSEADADKELQIIGVVVGTDGMTVTLTTGNQDASSYSVVALEVKDTAGNSIAVESSSASFMGKKAETIVDKLAPENVTNFVATVVDDVVVKLTWTASINSAKDLANQNVYQSSDGGKTYGGATPLGKEATSHEIKGLTPGMEYWVKLTTKDETGNESDGVIAKVMLPETGAGVAGLIFASAAIPSLWRRKKKK